MKFRKHFDYDVAQASDDASISFEGEESLTVQSMAEDADINVLMERYGITGRMPVNPRVPMYGDFSGITDYRSALHAVSDAYDAFMELPAKVRARFDNNPQLLLEFCENPANVKEAQLLGLLKEKDHGQSGGDPARPGGGRSEAGGSPAASGGAPEVGAPGRSAGSSGSGTPAGGG